MQDVGGRGDVEFAAQERREEVGEGAVEGVPVVAAGFVDGDTPRVGLGLGFGDPEEVVAVVGDSCDEEVPGVVGDGEGALVPVALELFLDAGGQGPVRLPEGW